MKKAVSFVLAALIIFSFAGCESSSGEDSYSITTGEDGNSYFEDDNGTMITVAELPSEVPYNESTITFDSVEAYQINDGYTYDLIILANFDTSSLSDEDNYFLWEKDATFPVSIDSEANGYDRKLASEFGIYNNSKPGLCTAVFSSPLGDKNRSFEGSTVNLLIWIDSGEKYVAASYKYKLEALEDIEEIEDQQLKESITKEYKNRKSLYG